MSLPHIRGSAALLLAALMSLLLVAGAGIARAADGARIQEVVTEDGQVSFLLTAVGLEPGESLDPTSVSVSIDGQSVAASTDAAQEAAVDRTVFLVMDASGSMDGIPLAAAKDAGQQYLASVPSDVSVGLITFADAAVVAVPATTDRSAVLGALQAVRANGSTALFDAALLATEELGTTGSRSMVVLSDGEDEGSGATEQQALAAITESGVAVDSVALTTGVGAEQLSRLATAGGGATVQANDAQTLTAAFESAALSASSQLLVTADLPSGQQPGTVPLTASVQVGDAVLTDDAIVVIDAEAAAAAAQVNADSAGPVPVSTASVGILQQPWFLPVAILVLFVALAIIGLLAFRLIDEDALQKRSVRRRIEAYGAAPESSGKSGGTGARDGLSAPTQRAVDMAEQMVKERDPGRTLETRLATAAIPMRPGEWIIAQVAVAFAALMIAALLSGFSPLWMGFGLVLGALVPWAVLQRRAARRRKEFYTALPDVLQLLSGSVASGYSFLQAADSVASQSEGVVASEFGRAVSEARLGVPIEDALDDVAERMESRDFAWVVMAVRINRQVGGNLAEVLRTVSKTLRERERVRRHISALTAEGRLSAWIIGLVPIVLAVYLAIVKPEFIELLITTPIGLLMLTMAILLELVGVLWISKMIKVEV
jgi:tight adherence protein B